MFNVKRGFFTVFSFQCHLAFDAADNTRHLCATSNVARGNTRLLRRTNIRFLCRTITTFVL